jgi:glycosyltransferase involved in cell wall biosynthesis
VTSRDPEAIRLIQVTRTALGGGAEVIASSLHRGLRRRGHHSWLASWTGNPDDPTVLQIPHRYAPNESLWTRLLLRAARAVKPRRKGRSPRRTLFRALRGAATPGRIVSRRLGREWFGYPGTSRIPDLPPETPDLIHLHNLHGRYFDLRQLAPMSKRVPVILTLHDEWMLTGHCAYTLGCERWRIGCGECPDLTIYPAIERDGTRANLKVKAATYADSWLYVSTPSQWLMDRAQASALAGGAVGWQVIPNGVDLRVFRAGDQAEARAQLGLPAEPVILLFTANRARRNVFKDWETVSAAAERAAAASDRPVLCIALGDDGPTVAIPNGELRFEPFRTDQAEVAAFYRAADLYLHAARAENLPTTILEALATGLPVVATAVGGIHEEVHSLAGTPGAWAGEAFDADQATGVLVDPGDAEGMGRAIGALLADPDLRATLGRNAARDAAARFDVERQLDVTVRWYREVIADWQARAGIEARASA